MQLSVMSQYLDSFGEGKNSGKNNVDAKYRGCGNFSCAINFSCCLSKGTVSFSNRSFGQDSSNEILCSSFDAILGVMGYFIS